MIVRSFALLHQQPSNCNKFLHHERLILRWMKESGTLFDFDIVINIIHIGDNGELL